MSSIVVIAIFAVIVAVIAFILNRYSIDTQSIVIGILVVIGYIVDRLLMHFFREYLVKQWYFTTVDTVWNKRKESIIGPFVYIGAAVYWVTQKVIDKFKKDI